MDKNVVLAVVLSFVVIMGFSFVQTTFFAPEEVEITQSQVVENQPLEGNPSEDISHSNDTMTIVNGNTVESTSDYSVYTQEGVEPAVVKTVSMVTDLYNIEFSTAGAYISSMTLTDHISDDGESVNMVYPLDETRGAFELSFGENYDKPVRSPFYFKKISQYEYHFTQVFTMTLAGGTQSPPFTITKIFRFVPNEYMMEMTIDM